MKIDYFKKYTKFLKQSYIKTFCRLFSKKSIFLKKSIA